MTDRRIPDLGANPLEVAFQDYQRMEQELGAVRDELASKTGMLQDLLRENEFLRRTYDKAVAERDRYQALAVNLATRAVGLRESVDRLIGEAVAARAAPEREERKAALEAFAPLAADGELAKEVRQALDRAGIAPKDVVNLVAPREITPRATVVPANAFQ